MIVRQKPRLFGKKSVSTAKRTMEQWHAKSTLNEHRIWIDDKIGAFKQAGPSYKLEGIVLGNSQWR